MNVNLTALNEQECIPVGCVPPAAVAIPGGLHQTLPGSRSLLDQTPPGADTPWDPREQTPTPQDQAPPGSRPSPC